MPQTRTSKPTAEEVIPEFLGGEMKESALRFAEYMRESKTPLKQYTTAQATQSAKYKGKEICRMVLYKAGEKKFYDLRRPAEAQSWLVIPFLNYLIEYENIIVNEGLHEIIWNNVKYCIWGENSGFSGADRGCGRNHGCAGGRSLTVCKKTLKGVSYCRTFTFWDPGDVETAAIKRLLELEKEARDSEIIIKTK